MTAAVFSKHYIGRVGELPGHETHPLIAYCLSLCGFGFDAEDETSWCSGWINFVCVSLGFARTKSAAARSWLPERAGDRVTETTLEEADGDCVVIFKRGGGDQPGREVLEAPGHVAFFSRLIVSDDDGHGVETKVEVVGGNQSNNVTIAVFPVAQVLAVVRLKAVA